MRQICAWQTSTEDAVNLSLCVLCLCCLDRSSHLNGEKTTHFWRVCPRSRSLRCTWEVMDTKDIEALRWMGWKKYTHYQFSYKLKFRPPKHTWNAPILHQNVIKRQEARMLKRCMTGTSAFMPRRLFVARGTSEIDPFLSSPLLIQTKVFLHVNQYESVSVWLPSVTNRSGDRGAQSWRILDNHPTHRYLVQQPQRENFRRCKEVSTL